VVETLAPTPTAAPTLTPTAIPASVSLPAPAYEKQEINNCGPATLTMHLRFYGWEGDQATIDSMIKPIPQDRNVNVEELAAYVHTQVEGLEILYRVGGDIDMLRRLLAAGFPVMVEEAFIMAESYWLNDDRWAGHYLLLTAYDDATQRFTGQDSFVGKNISIPYSVLDKNWKAFNRVYVLVYPYDQRDTVSALLGEQWDENANRQHALDLAQRETEADSTDSYAWFNYGTNLVYFERYGQAAQAYDQARLIGLPQRMLRYQFGPFFAYFHSARIDDLLALTEYALKRTPNSEEALLWRGWGMYRKNDREEALKAFQEALAARPEFPDAIYALKFLQEN
jgi:tetratricopeptide (TPR) repeat protein